MKLNQERYKSFLEELDKCVIRENGRYSFDEFCCTNKLYSNLDRQRADSIFIICPFHKDENPSLSINLAKGRFKCFACNVFGGYLDFVTLYDKEVVGLRTSKVQKANEILRNDLELQERLGFTSLFQSEHDTVGKLEKLKFNSFRLQRSRVSTYPELADLMKKQKYGEKVIQYALILMQSGLSPEAIWQQVQEIDTMKVKSAYTLKDLDGGVV